jgi:exodeoxyribonuclease V alpha subunit
LPWVEKHIGLALAESQVVAIRLALMSKVLVMTGGPGVGKTTIVKAILRILAAKGIDNLLCAPTGRAAKRMTEATSFEARQSVPMTSRPRSVFGYVLDTTIRDEPDQGH